MLWWSLSIKLNYYLILKCSSFKLGGKLFNLKMEWHTFYTQQRQYVLNSFSTIETLATKCMYSLKHTMMFILLSLSNLGLSYCLFIIYCVNLYLLYYYIICYLCWLLANSVAVYGKCKKLGMTLKFAVTGSNALD